MGAVLGHGHPIGALYRLGMGDSKNFMSRYIMRVIIMIIDIITILVLANSQVISCEHRMK